MRLPCDGEQQLVVLVELQLPKKPLPPHTTSFFLTALAIVGRGYRRSVVGVSHDTILPKDPVDTSVDLVPIVA